ncbi:MAG: VapE domain-containing protein [Methylophilaceae bacterium]|nr:virulence-associated E family protein [Methyloradius sp.]
MVSKKDAAKAAFDKDDIDSALIKSEKGKPLSVPANIEYILQNDPEWQGVLKLNQMSGEVDKVKQPPITGGVGPWRDSDDTRLSVWCSRKYGLHGSTKNMFEVVNAVADDHSYSPVRDYLNSLKWDGKRRLKDLCKLYFGANEAPDKYLELAMVYWMRSAVQRAFQPGCKADCVLILEGDQGKKKSSALKVLCGAAWFMDTPIKIGSTDAYQAMQGIWIVELAELDSLNRSESSSSKAFFSSTADRYRAAYGRRVITIPRQCVFAGSVNHRHYLRDETDNRRYFPMWCTFFDLAALAADRDQLWAEAVADIKAGERWWPEDEDEKALFKSEQEKRYVGDAYEDKIERWLRDTPMPSNSVSMEAILGKALGLDVKSWTKAEQMRVGTIMLRLKWIKRRPDDGSGKRPYRYFPPSDWNDIPVNGESSDGGVEF